MIELLNELASVLIKIAGAGVVLMVSYIVVPWVKNELIPWAKDHRLYGIIQSFVLSAEKMAETGMISKEAKKDYVISCLERKGITVTQEIKDLIECAVEELDLAIESGITMVGDLFEEIEFDDEVDDDGDDDTGDGDAVDDAPSDGEP